MLKRLSARLTIAASGLLLSSAMYAATAAHKHVLLVGFDGTRADAFQVAYQQLKAANKDTHFLKMMQNGVKDFHVYAGGVTGDKTEQATVSEPGWTTVLTGLWALHNHIVKNGSLEAGDYNTHYPTIYNYIKDNIPNATAYTFTDWQPMQVLAAIEHKKLDIADVNAFYRYHSLDNLVLVDKQMSQMAARVIRTNAPTFTYIHFDNPDENGHTFGFSTQVPQYITAIKQGMDNVDTLLQAVDASRAQGQEWLVVITADHGGHGTVHGTQQWSDKNIFGVFYDADNPTYSGAQTINTTIGQTTITPTILSYLGIRYAELDGEPLIH